MTSSIIGRSDRQPRLQYLNLGRFEQAIVNAALARNPREPASPRRGLARLVKMISEGGHPISRRRTRAIPARSRVVLDGQ
jgi:hypothetical protein